MTEQNLSYRRRSNSLTSRYLTLRYGLLIKLLYYPLNIDDMDQIARKKYLEEILKLCGTDGIMVIDKTDRIKRLKCPFYVVAVLDVGELTKGLICLVFAVKLDSNLMDVYIIEDKAYYHYNFRLVVTK